MNLLCQITTDTNPFVNKYHHDRVRIAILKVYCSTCNKIMQIICRFITLLVMVHIYITH